MYFRIAAVLLGLVAALAPSPQSPIEREEPSVFTRFHHENMREYGPLWSAGQDLDQLRDYILILTNNLDSVMKSRSSMDKIWHATAGQAILESIGEFDRGAAREAMLRMTLDILNRIKKGRSPVEFEIWLKRKLGSLKGAPWKAEITNIVLNSGQAEGINWEVAARVRQLIAEDREEKSIRSLDDCIPPGVTDIQIKNQPGRTGLNRDGSITVDGAFYAPRLSDYWYMLELRKMAIGFTEGPVIELKSVIDECEKRVGFVPVNHRDVPDHLIGHKSQSQLNPQRVMNLIYSEIPNIVKAIRGFHEMGLLFDFDNFCFAPVPGRESEGTQRLEILGLYPLKMFVNAHTRQLVFQEACEARGVEDPECRCRVGDMIKLVSYIEILELGMAIKGWDERLTTLIVGLNNKAWDQVPDYESWIELLSEDVDIRGPGEILNQGIIHKDPFAICRWLDFIGSMAAEECDSQDIDERWTCVNGPQLIELTQRTAGHPICRAHLIDKLIGGLERISQGSGVVQFGLWLHAQVKNWGDMKLCSRWLNAKRVPFSYIVCPEELLWETQVDQPVENNQRWLSQPPTKAEVERLWSLLRIPELSRKYMGSTQSADAALKVARYLFQIPTSDDVRPHLEGLEDLGDSQTAALTRLAVTSPEWIQFADACGLWEKGEAVLPFVWHVSIDASTPYWVTWREGLCEKFASRFATIPDSHKKFVQSYIFNCVTHSWKSGYYRGNIGLTEFAASLPGFTDSGICTNMQEYAIQKRFLNLRGALLEHFWLCGQAVPVAVVCGSMQELEADLVVAYEFMHAGLPEYMSDFATTGILGLVDQCQPYEQRRAVRSILTMFGSVQQVYHLTHAQLRDAISSLELLPHFCTFNRDVLENQIGNLAGLAHTLCPELQFSLTALQGIVNAIPKPTRINLLRVRRDHAFTDASELLTDMFVEAEVPAGVVFGDETAASDESIQEWLHLAGREAASLLFTGDGTDFKPDVPAEYHYAFGRLLALALVHERSPGINFPGTFFNTLLVRRLEGDTSPLGPIDKIREGLEYFYPVSRISQQLNSEEFKLLFI